jgi:D-hydroxyproline dehydrogenase
VFPRDGTHITIIGGGVVGLCCGIQLQRVGADVLILDAAGSTSSVSWGNAGHLAIEQVEPLASVEVLASALRRLFMFGGALDFRIKDIGVWGPWALRFISACNPKTFAKGREALKILLAGAIPAWTRLASSIGRPELVLQDGHLAVWESSVSAAREMASWLKMDRGVASAEPIDNNLLSRLRSELKAPLAGGLAFKNTGQISDPGVALDALKTALVGNAGVIREQRVEQLLVERNRIRLILKDGEDLVSDQVVIAAGVGSGSLMRSLGYVTPLIAERGYHIEGKISGGWENLPPVVFEERSMIVTRFGGRLRATSFIEFAREHSAPDPRKWLRLRTHVRELGLPMADPISQWMGARPTLPDYLPAIGIDRRLPNLFYAFGHQHLGLTLAALTGELISSLARDGPSDLGLEPFSLDRFAALQNASALGSVH